MAHEDEKMTQGEMLRAAAAVGLPETASDEEYFVLVKQKIAEVLFPFAELPTMGLDDRGPEGDSLLHVACTWGDLRAVQLLIHAGADVNATGDMDQTPLHIAVSARFLDIVEFLLARGAVQTKDAFGYTPLEWAKQMEYTDITEALKSS